MSEEQQEVTIRPSENGPYLVKGPVKLIDADGNDFAPGGNIALCRCGQSKNKPFCDGSHTAAEFKAPAGKMNP